MSPITYIGDKDFCRHNTFCMFNHGYGDNPLVAAAVKRADDDLRGGGKVVLIEAADWAVIRQAALRHYIADERVQQLESAMRFMQKKFHEERWGLR